MRFSATLILAAAAALACGGTAVKPTVADRSVAVTNDRSITRTHESPFLLQDRTQPDTVYLSAVELQRGSCEFYVSHDRGRTWAKGAAPNPAPATCSVNGAHPQAAITQMAQAPNGTLYYAFQGEDPAAGGSRSVFLARSADHGAGWQVTVVDAAAKATADSILELNFQPHFAIDPGNSKRIVVMWRRSYNKGPGGTRPWMAVSEDAGATFGTPYRAFDEDSGFDGPRILFGLGKLWAFYENPAPRGSGGSTKLFAAASTDLGKTWAKSEISEAADSGQLQVLFDGGRKVFHAVWNDNRNKELDTWYASSADGVKWSDGKRLNDDPIGNRAGQYFPVLSLTAGGRLDAAWYDYRDDPYPAPAPKPPASALNYGSNLGKEQQVYYTYSGDGGRTWARNLPISDLKIDRTKGVWNGQYNFLEPPALLATDSWALLAWSDTRNGDAQNSAQDIFSGSVPFAVTQSSTGDPLLPSLGLAGLAGLAVGAGAALLLAVALARRRRSRA